MPSHATTDQLPEGVSKPEKHLEKLLRLPEFVHLAEGEARVAFLMRGYEEFRGGRTLIGSVHLPGVQGQLKDVFIWMLMDKLGYMPDALCILDAQWWVDVGSEREREIQIHHLLSRIIHKVDKYGATRFDAEGRPVFGLVDPDVMEFVATVRRYGPHNDTIRAFIDACDASND